MKQPTTAVCHTAVVSLVPVLVDLVDSSDVTFIQHLSHE